MRVTFDHVQDEAAHIKSFYFRSSERVHYLAGQFIRLYLPHAHPDERGDRHWFTLSSSPSQPLLSITTKIATQHCSTFKRALLRLQPGDEVDMETPMGDFVLPKQTDIPLLFVAGGIGITPYRSMVRWLLDADEHRSIKLLYAVSDPAEFISLDLFNSYGLDLQCLVTEPNSAWRGESGHLTAQRILEAQKDMPQSIDGLVYLSGPEPMIESISNELLKLKLPKHQLVTDFFPGYNAL